MKYCSYFLNINPEDVYDTHPLLLVLNNHYKIAILQNKTTLLCEVKSLEIKYFHENLIRGFKPDHSHPVEIKYMQAKKFE